MIILEDRRSLAQNIDSAHKAGVRLRLACEIAGIDERTLQRWKAHGGLVQGDGRPEAVRATPSHGLSAAERAHLLSVANEPRFASMPPARIVPMLADEGGVHRKRIELCPCAAHRRTKRTPGTRQSAQGGANSLAWPPACRSNSPKPIWAA